METTVRVAVRGVGQWRRAVLQRPAVWRSAAPARRIACPFLLGADHVSARTRGMATRAERKAARAALADATESKAEVQLRDAGEFAALAAAKLKQLAGGIGEMSGVTSGAAQITLEEGHLSVEAEDGVRFHVTVEPVSQVLLSASLQGDAYAYHYDERRGHWVSDRDEHFLDELLARDLMQHISGVPKL